MRRSRKACPACSELPSPQRCAACSKGRPDHHAWAKEEEEDGAAVVAGRLQQGVLHRSTVVDRGAAQVALEGPRGALVECDRLKRLGQLDGLGARAGAGLDDSTLLFAYKSS